MSDDLERFHFFWGSNFSQWAPSPFIIDSIKYSCAEQYMMAEKARLFGDKSAEERIMATSDPAEQQRLGKSVRGFDDAVWKEKAKDIVYKGSWAKYSQNETLRLELFATGNKTIVEASATDTLWGIGLRASDPRAYSRATWRGFNWLGEILTRVRDSLRALLTVTEK